MQPSDKYLYGNINTGMVFIRATCKYHIRRRLKGFGFIILKTKMEQPSTLAIEA